MIAAEELAGALRTALPPELQPHAAALADLLVAASQAKGSAPPTDPAMEPLLRALAGRQLNAGQALLSFGSGNQLGDVAIGDLVGGDQTRISLQISPTIAPNATGDVVVGQVGAGAGVVAVGKNIIQIGALVVPAWSVLALIGLLLAAAAVGYLRLRGPARMVGTFNVAVADFALDDGSGLRASDEGRRLSAQAFAALRQQQQVYLQANSADVISIWHDSLSWREKSVAIGMIGGATAAEREQAARAKLDILGADMLIYGSLDSQGLVTLRFYVRPELATASGDGAIAGDYQVGAPLRPSGTRLTTRAGAIFWLLKGLQYDSEGRQERALDLLGRVPAALPDWREDGEGKEILYFFQGQAAAFLALAEPDQAGFAQRLDEAERSFARAAASNPLFLRATVGQGSLALLRAQCALGAAPCAPLPTAGAARVQAFATAHTAIQVAVDTYKHALDMAPSSSDRLWAQGVAPMSLGTAYLTRGELAFLQRDDVSAAADYAAAISAIEAGLPPTIAAGDRRLLAQNYLTLGTAHWRRGLISAQAGQLDAGLASYAQARAALAACLAQGDNSDDAFLRDEVLPRCAARDQETATALARLQGGTP